MTGDRELLFYTDLPGFTGREEAAGLTRRLVKFASEYGLSGNVWQQWLTYFLLMHENAFSITCERRKIDREATIIRLAESDMEYFMELMHRDASELPEPVGMMTDYRLPYDAPANEIPESPGRRIAGVSMKLAGAESASGFCRILADEYEKYGTGSYGLYRAFRTSDDNGSTEIVPIAETRDVTFDDLIGYESQKEALKFNTEAFISGRQANNVLLYGDSGTGKSTSVHALMHEYFDRGLRLVEISRQHRAKLPQVLSEIKKRNYKFIIFLDDLSFEEDESDYKELKAMVEGALESREDRVLVYATSNRRHLIRETWGDRADMEYHEDIHRSDTMEEKLSLASRFGVTIYYGKPGQKEYLNIVRELAVREGIELEGKELEDEARRWELRHGGMTGRAASQLIGWLQGQQKGNHDGNE